MKKGYNILLALMGLNIGGAETHVVELAKGLTEKGFGVVVASNGGVYQEELEKNHIKHYQLPLHNKMPGSMIKSYRGLARIIEKENIHLVHAHARIPAFLCGLLHSKMKFPFVTTAHGVFNTSWGLKYMTNWGQRTIAVSEDIRQYLLDNYNILGDHITVSINGIDTQKFSSSVDTNSIRKEFQLENHRKRIVHVSRLNKDTSDVAFHLIQMAGELKQEIDDLEIIIVGDGDVYQELRTQGEQANNQLGGKTILFTGGRTDVNKWIAVADIFVGISRAALEAMATEKPVILAGNKGYMGMFSKEKLNRAISSNFTCRGEQPLTKQLLEGDLIQFFKNYDDEKIRMLGTFQREMIEEKYSVNRMVQDNIAVYLQLLGKGK